MIVDNDTFFGCVLEFLKEGKDVTIPVKGASMLPLIREGKDTVVLEGVEGGTPEGMPVRRVKPYDIVLFRLNGKYILHRILSEEDGVFVIQGDGILKNVEYCPPDNIFGRAKVILRGGECPLDPYSGKMIRLFRIWLWMKPVRRYLLGVYKRLSGYHRCSRSETGR